jgi:mono/diheme cytochrome c family protein
MRGAILLLLLLAGCDNMARQPRYDAYGEGRLFADGKAMQLPPDGTVARDAPAIAAAERRPPMSAALLARGRERYGIYCAMCHAADGAGDGVIPARGFPRPADFRAPAQRALTADQVYRVVSDGRGAMYGFADRVPPRDRWAMAAYVQALQRSGRR